MPELLEKEGRHGSVLDIRFEEKSHAPDIVSSALMHHERRAISQTALSKRIPSIFAPCRYGIPIMVHVVCHGPGTAVNF